MQRINSGDREKVQGMYSETPKIHDAFDFHDKRHGPRWENSLTVKYYFANVSSRPRAYFHIYINTTTFSFIELRRLLEYRTNQTCRIRARSPYPTYPNIIRIWSRIKIEIRVRALSRQLYLLRKQTIENSSPFFFIFLSFSLYVALALFLLRHEGA